jgi:hypothetical protein
MSDLASPAASRSCRIIEPVGRSQARRTALSWSLLDGATGSAYLALTTGGLLSGHDTDMALTELVETVGVVYMLMQGDAVELGQEIDTPETGVDAVGDRHVHEPVLARERHGGLGPVLGERKKAGALAATHDDTKHIAGVDGLTAGV